MNALSEQRKIKSEEEHSHAVRAMFSGIAWRYDLLNHLLSANIDKRWRRKVREILTVTLSKENAKVLDVACGTGDLSIELSSGARAAVIGTDFCRPMLSVAQTKNAKIPWIEADALRLSFPDETFDAVTIAFGLRNLASVESGLNEFHRILKTGGQLVILEFSAPVVPGFRKLFDLYFSHVLPRIGGLISGERDAYEYLPDSVSKFPDQKALVELMTESGFQNVTFKNLTGGIAAIHTGQKEP
ncbi:bifunctional demethylmenaquinone methyltransferase/2-methoxy-6-polyprenyl-1,4-benzoquinol methylase UbiE [Leptolyngbya sp. 7M]|uniref:bifunctional demethylmenaquinone methyltransferase/2-methoxy-6-polyprenyl-1,4-benzoquinol methylase UbiE n=1 Tax=Leptolyngbya sp. 7M TaxID=2812896 RepID=UPI001B8CBC4E|nr:bifunctional demethylmenaquinone methyltransferase/2-methoxy-6-polyprenyl-1,4-benzoquinol methylase UbiE [Leptolyngbya sp. 7M]QYO67851.1 bifunctional demethylmenaquinone methyltransferase/2-methoxy-6-polyprenyl-1,4-benzoquinol methylase UbiE [Leptolyngbya sp. 7M]